MKINFNDIIFYEKERKKTKKRYTFVYAINIDMKNDKEHILVGEEVEVLKAIHNQEADLLYNGYESLGSFFFSVPTNFNDEWTDFIDFIIKGYGHILYPKNFQKKMYFLKDRFKTKNPINMFVTSQTFFQILYCHELNNGYNIFRDNTSYLFKYFRTDESLEFWESYQNNMLDMTTENFENTTNHGENEIKITVVNGKEYFIVYKSFKPLIDIYLNKIAENKLIFKRCSVCKTEFMAKHRHMKFCSDKCKKEQVLVNKQTFKEKNKNDKVKKNYQSTYTFWYNRMIVLRNRLLITQAERDMLEEVEQAFSSFKKKSKEFKNGIKQGTVEEQDFADYLIEQEVFISNFFEDWKKNKKVKLI